MQKKLIEREAYSNFFFFIFVVCKILHNYIIANEQDNKKTKKNIHTKL